MEELLKAWEKEYRHFEELKQTETRHLQSIKINARALQLKYCIKALKEQLTLTDVVFNEADLCDESCEFYCTKGGTQEKECFTKESEVELLAFSKFLLNHSYVRGKYYPETLVRLFKASN